LVAPRHHSAWGGRSLPAVAAPAFLTKQQQ
jgi:hypothetical protein